MSVIVDQIVNFLARQSDRVFSGRNRTRIVLGTDRKNTINSGYGAGGEDDPESSTIDIVAGYLPDSGDVNYTDDKSRIYVSGKTDPDDYFEIDVGTKAEGVAAIVHISDYVYLKARKSLKIVNDKFSILIEENGRMTVKSDEKIIFDSSDILIGDSSATETPAWASKLLTELTKIKTSIDSLTVTGGVTTPAVLVKIPYDAPTSISQLGATKTKIS